MSAMDKNLDMITYAVSLIAKAVIISDNDLVIVVPDDYFDWLGVKSD